MEGKWWSIYVKDINVRTTILTELDHADSQKEQNKGIPLRPYQLFAQ